MSDEILTFASPEAFGVGAYTDNEKALCRKSLATTDYNIRTSLITIPRLAEINFKSSLCFKLSRRDKRV